MKQNQKRKPVESTEDFKARLSGIVRGDTREDAHLYVRRNVPPPAVVRPRTTCVAGPTARATGKQAGSKPCPLCGGDHALPQCPIKLDRTQCP